MPNPHSCKNLTKEFYLDQLRTETQKKGVFTLSLDYLYKCMCIGYSILLHNHTIYLVIIKLLMYNVIFKYLQYI